MQFQSILSTLAFQQPLKAELQPDVRKQAYRGRLFGEAPQGLRGPGGRSLHKASRHSHKGRRGQRLVWDNSYLLESTILSCAHWLRSYPYTRDPAQKCSRYLQQRRTFHCELRDDGKTELSELWCFGSIKISRDAGREMGTQTATECAKRRAKT